MQCKNDVYKASLRIGVSYRDELKSICNKICTIATVAQYTEYKIQLDNIANILTDIARWVAW